MPDFLTHCLFAQDTLAWQSAFWQKSLGDHQLLMNLGAQGPDPFYYVDPSPGKRIGATIDLEVTGIGIIPGSF